jgi:hypothetical protein
MKVLLIAPDSKLPNLALMKYSTHFKSKGYEVGFKVGEPDIIVASILFKKNRAIPLSWPHFYPTAKEYVLGGPGYGPTIMLPPEVERCRPDYTLYQDFKDSIGRVTIGCPRDCYFCVVPSMGGVRYVQPVRDFYEKGTCRILDDNILALPGAFEETANWLIGGGIKVHWDGLDIRHINEQNASLIAEMKHDGGPFFAFDMLECESEVRRGVQYLTDAGMRSNSLRFYVYLHDEANIPSAMERWRILRELKVEPFLMVNADDITPRLRRIRRFGCRPAVWRAMSPEQVFDMDVHELSGGAPLPQHGGEQ